MARQDRSFVQTENANHRTDHAVVGAIVARTWRLPQVIAHAVRLHHDFAVLADSTVAQEVRYLVAIAALAEHLVAQHEGLKEQGEWLQHGGACLALLQIGEPEVEAWIDQLYPVFEGVVVA
jgi:HD-like signal output (HDOD) protein